MSDPSWCESRISVSNPFGNPQRHQLTNKYLHRGHFLYKIRTNKKKFYITPWPSTYPKLYKITDALTKRSSYNRKNNFMKDFFVKYELFLTLETLLLQELCDQELCQNQELPVCSQKQRLGALLLGNLYPVPIGFDLRNIQVTGIIEIYGTPCSSSRVHKS